MIGGLRVLTRPAVIAAIAASVVAITISSIGSSAQVHLTKGIAGKARGAFDILVTPRHGHALDLASTNGLVEPNYLAFAGKGGISFEQLSAIEHLQNVSVAAPVSVVGQVTAAWSTPGISLPASATPRIYEFTLNQKVTDGITKRLVSTQTLRAFLPGSASTADAVTTAAGGIASRDGSGDWTVLASPLPPTSSLVVAVDGRAEERLLGRHVVALEQLAGIRDASPGRFTVATLNDAIAHAVAKKKLTGNEGLFPTMPRTSPLSMVPVIVTTTDAAASSIELRTRVIGEGPEVERDVASGGPDALARWVPKDAGAGVSDVTIDENFQPLTGAAWGVNTKGQLTQAGGGGGITQMSGVLADRPTYQAQSSDGQPTMAIDPQGMVPATGPEVKLSVNPESGVGGVSVASREVQYRQVGQVTAASQAGLYPIRTFDPAQLVPISPDEGRVSMGIYDVPKLTVDQSNIAKSGTILQPTFNTAGLVSRPPGAIADIRDARLLRGSTPIDAIRVRVAGISTFDAAAQQKVEAVASAISSLGMNVQVVIGSSPQDVRINVPQYVDKTGAVVPLGTVTQQWTTMGAALRVNNELSQASLLLVLLGAIAALGGAVASQLLEASATQRDAAILRVMGWSRSRIRRRVLAAPVIASAVGLLAFGVAWATSARDLTMASIGIALCLLVPAACLVTAQRALAANPMTAAKVGDSASATTRPRAHSRGTMALRLLLATRVRFASMIALIIVATASIGFASATFANRAAAAGPTLLANTLVSALASEHLALLLIAITIGVGFAVLLWRYLLHQRRTDERRLSIFGWNSGERRRLTHGMLAWVMVPAVLLGAFTSWVLAQSSVDSSAPVAAGAALVGGCAIALLLSRLTSERNPG